MTKLFTVLFEFTDVLKKVDIEPSALAVTSIFTPLVGIVEVMVTTKGKSGPGAAAWLLPEAGEVAIVRLLTLLSFGFLHEPIAMINTSTLVNTSNIFFFISIH
jgi:hypothetical protein